MIQPQYLSLSDLFSKRLFHIPEYQRFYSWTSHERQDLFNDIEKIYSKNTEHFMATVVCLRAKKETLGTDEFYHLDVVDGQQRLTTLIILFKAIQLALDKKTPLFKEIKDLLVKPQNSELLLLQTNHDSSHHFSNYLRKGKAKSSDEASTIADREILKAIEDCNEFVSVWMADKKKIEDLTAIIKNRLYFLFHEIEDVKMVYTVFEVLNSRGMEVSWLDRLKSALMGKAYEVDNNRYMITELQTIWRDIYRVIGLRQGLSTESLRYTATLYTEQSQSRPLSEQDSVDVLSLAADTPDKILEVAQFLLEVTKVCDKVLRDIRIGAVTQISQARLLAVAIHLREDIKEGIKKELLRCWEKVTFRIFGMYGKDSRTQVGNYVRLAREIYKDKIMPSKIKDSIIDIGSDFLIDGAIESSRKTNCYEGGETELRYLMYRYEEYLNGGKITNEHWNKIWMASASKSIEHISPQKKKKKYTHWMGNLLLLPPGINSRLQDKKPSDKIEAYRKTGMNIANEVAEMINNNDGKWTEKTIIEREEKILEWARTEWGDCDRD